MRTCPVGPRDRRDNLAVAAFVAVMTMYDFTHFGFLV
jgi:hypothetical protein